MVKGMRTFLIWQPCWSKKTRLANLEMVKNNNGMSLLRLAFGHFEYYTLTFGKKMKSNFLKQKKHDATLDMVKNKNGMSPGSGTKSGLWAFRI